jgi:glycolate oxidase iron-sulfur subunit
LSRLGFEVVVAKGAGCCGALVHHMGWEQSAHAMAKANVAAWIGECDGVISASGCGTSVKDYGFMLRGDGEWADKARRISSLTRDISEFLAERELPPPAVGQGLKVAYHSACSMQHGQQIREQPKALLRQAGFEIADVSTAPDVVATGNIGCMTQIACGTELPVVHTVELLDWATGGPKPGALDR